MKRHLRQRLNPFLSVDFGYISCSVTGVFCKLNANDRFLAMQNPAEATHVSLFDRQHYRSWLGNKCFFCLQRPLEVSKEFPCKLQHMNMDRCCHKNTILCNSGMPRQTIVADKSSCRYNFRHIFLTLSSLMCDSVWQVPLTRYLQL